MTKLTIKEYREKLLKELEEINKNPTPFIVKKIEVEHDPAYKKLIKFIEYR